MRARNAQRPAHAIIAALSVVRERSGKTDRDAVAPSPSAASVARSSELAATPPESASTLDPFSAVDRLDALDERRHDRTLEGGEEVGEVRVERGPGRGAAPSTPRLSNSRSIAVLSPEKEKSCGTVARPADREREPRAVAARGDAVDRRDRRDSRGPRAARPCRRLRRGRRRACARSGRCDRARRERARRARPRRRGRGTGTRRRAPARRRARRNGEKRWPSR